MNKYILAFDPSGNYVEGKGTTGWVLIKASKESTIILKEGTIRAKFYKSTCEYWKAHMDLIEDITRDYKFDMVVEDYRLYASKAKSQINSSLETPRLIGVLLYYCFLNNIPIHLQAAATVKSRWSNGLLNKKGYKVLTLNEHTRDALRHAVHYKYFRKEKTNV